MQRRKTIGVIGRGTAGAQAVIHLQRHSDHIIDWYYDPSVNTKAVGEGSTLSLPRQMSRNIGFGHRDLSKVDGTFKIGIYKEGWGKNGEPFFHDFPAPEVAWHFDAVKLQNYIFNLCKESNKINFIEGSFTPDDVDADFVMDCSGVPKDLNEDAFVRMECIPVNAVYVSHCDWDAPRFNFTLTVARPYGWVFGIPLGSRCAIGYMYNSNINTLDEIKEDVEVLLNAYDLVCTRTAAFPFDSYYRKQNFTKRVGYNGDSSFFLEPLEATSTSMMETVNRCMFDIFANAIPEEVNKMYADKLEEICDMIMLHYYAGSKFNTPFWSMAKEKASVRIKKAFGKEGFFNAVMNGVLLPEFCKANPDVSAYGTWAHHSFFQNIHGLGLYNEFRKKTCD